MLTHNAGLGDLGFGWKSIGRAVKGAVKKTVVAPTKFAVQKTLVAPTKIIAKGAVSAAKGSAAVGSQLVRGNVTGAARSAVGVAVNPLKTGAQLTKQAGQTAYEASKAVTNLALGPIRSRLNVLKDRRAQLLSYKARGSKVPTTAEKAQARKDVKSMLSSKGPHGKMLAWLAGPEYNYNGFGVVGYDDAALAAIATALTASLVKIIGDAAKSKFAPADAAKAGVRAGAGKALTQVVPQEYQDIYQAAKAAEQPAPAAEEPEPAAEPVTPEEVATEPAVEAEEAATEQETEAMEGALADAGLLAGFREAVPAATAPEAMDMPMARKIAGAAQRMVCGMSRSAVLAIGGHEGLQVAGTFCRALQAGDEAAVRATLPVVVQIAARASAGITAEAVSSMPREFGALRGKKARKSVTPFQQCVAFRMDQLGASRSDAEYACSSELRGVDANDIGMLAAFGDADPEGLAYGLSGVGPDDIAAANQAEAVTALALLPAAAAVLVGIWMVGH